MGIFDNAVSVIIGNKIVDSITTSDNGVIYQRSEHTRLSIDVPLNLTYSDAFNITGHLTTANGTGISGEQVLLKVGNTVMDSTTTGNNGEYSFTQTPVSSGTHLFQVVYAGSNTYGDSESSTVTRDVNKETTVLTATPDKQKYDIGDTVVLTVGFTDDEGNNLINADNVTNLKINYNGTWQDVPKILQFLAYSTIKIQYQEGYNSTWELRHNESSNYAYSHINIPLNIVTPTLITSSATNQVITSGDSTTVTATLLDQDGDAIPNRTLNYNVKHGSTTLDTGSATTNSNGQISVSYTGTAIGQVDVVVSYGSLLQETFVLYDSLFVDDITKTYSQNGWSARNVSVNRGTNDTTLTTSLTSGYGGYYRDISSLNSFCIEFDLNTDKSYGSVIDVQSTSSEFLLGSVTSLLHIGEDVHYKLEFKNNNIVISNNKGDTPITVADTNYSYFRIRVRYDATITYKNFIIYPL